MARGNVPLLAFNRGRVSPLALARTDIERVALSAEEQTNWMPRILGSMMLRPGFGYTGSTYLNKKAYHVNFIYALSDQAQIEFTDYAMRVKIDDAPISRVSVSTAVTNGTFTSNVTGWTDADETGAESDWTSAGGAGVMYLRGNGANAAIRTQIVTVAGADLNKEHALNINIVGQNASDSTGGSVTLLVGSSAGAQDYIAETDLAVGFHSLAFTPTGNFHITLKNKKTYAVYVNSIVVASAGDMVLTSPYSEAKLPMIRYDASGDVIFLACSGIQQRKIERRATRSWSIVLYQPEDGPFRNENISTIRLTPSALNGDAFITASGSVFKPEHVGALFRIASNGQQVTKSIIGEDEWSEPIRVTGVGSARNFSYTITGTWSGTVVLQSSAGEPGSWVDVSGKSYTVNTSTSYSDGLDNQIIYYRLGIKVGGYASGTAVVGLTYDSGSITGIARISAYSSPTSVQAHVLSDFGGTSSSDNWSEGQWSQRRGYPSGVSFDEGRIWWGGKDNIIGSVSDAFESFDDTIEGDSGPIIRSLGSGPVDTISWLLALQRLCIGCEMSEKVIRSNSLDEPITPTVFNIKSPSTKGSTAVAPVKIDTSGMFVRNNRLFELKYDAGELEYQTIDLTSFVPEIGGSGFVKLAVQRYPDTRIHCIKNDGTAAILIFDRNEDMKCWIDIETDGAIEDVIVMPGASSAVEDSVYYTVKRTVNGSDVRYHEKMALESECVGGTQNKQADSFIAGTQSSSVTITGLSHLNGKAVVVWADGVNYSPRVNGVQTTFTVSGGSITLPSAVTSYVVGLPYSARYKSSKLAYASQGGTALLQSKRIEALGVIMRNTHNRGLRYGRNFDNLYEMPLVEGGADVSANQIWNEYDERPFEFEQEFDTDSRLCLAAQAPMPCTLLAAVMKIATNDRV